jgi:DNA-binding transcriptional ArsR family regulator
MSYTKKEKAARLATLRPHPVRDHIVQVMRSYERPISPTQLTQATGGTLGSVAYHVRMLVAAGVVELADEGRVRGAVEHFYTLALPDDEVTLSDPATVLLSICGALTVPSREEGGYPQPVTLDERGRRDLHAVVEELKPRVLAIAADATARTSR